MKKFIVPLVALFALGVSGTADAFSDAEYKKFMAESKYFREADARLNSAWKAAINRLTPDQQKELRKDQKEWLASRETLVNRELRPGRTRELAFTILTKERAKYLERWIPLESSDIPQQLLKLRKRKQYLEYADGMEKLKKWELKRDINQRGECFHEEFIYGARLDYRLGSLLNGIGIPVYKATIYNPVLETNSDIAVMLESKNNLVYSYGKIYLHKPKGLIQYPVQDSTGRKSSLLLFEAVTAEDGLKICPSDLGENVVNYMQDAIVTAHAKYSSVGKPGNVEGIDNVLEGQYVNGCYLPKHAGVDTENPYENSGTLIQISKKKDKYRLSLLAERIRTHGKSGGCFGSIEGEFVNNVFEKDGVRISIEDGVLTMDVSEGAAFPICDGNYGRLEREILVKNYVTDVYDAAYGNTLE